MKKLMIAVAIVCATAMSQAATAKWTANSIYEPGTTTKAGSDYTAYFIQSSALALTDAQDYLEAKNLASVVAKATTGATKTLSAGMGSIANWGNFGNSETVAGYLLIVNADSSMAYLSGVASGETGAEGTQATIAFGKMDGTGSFGTDTRVASNWYAVPEPTSGLLLLLGVAGLALKRRRA